MCCMSNLTVQIKRKCSPLQKTRSDKETAVLQTKVQKLESLCRALQLERKKTTPAAGSTAPGTEVEHTHCSNNCLKSKNSKLWFIYHLGNHYHLCNCLHVIVCTLVTVNGTVQKYACVSESVSWGWDAGKGNICYK